MSNEAGLMKRFHWIWIGLLWLPVIALVNPVGEFPMNDDWGYARVVQHLVETGEYHPGDWPVMTLFTQVLWGGLFAGIFGFSFTILRISTLILAVVGTYGIYRESLHLGRDTFWAIMAAATLALNPLFFNLSFTFMTDVPFAVLALMAIMLYRRALQDDQVKWWVWATILTTAATLIRQPGLLLAPAFGLIACRQRPKWRTVVLAAGSILFTYGILLTYIVFLGQSGETPGTPDSLWPLIRRLRPSFLLPQLFTRGGVYAFYLAIFVAPLLLPRLSTLKGQWQSRPGRSISILAAFFSLLTAWFSWTGLPMGNMINFPALGPTTLYGENGADVQGIALPLIIWPLLKTVGYTCLFLLINELLQKVFTFWRESKPKEAVRWWKAGLGLFGSAYWIYLLIDRVAFDRYLLVLVPVVVLLLTPSQPLVNSHKWKTAALLWIILMGIFSIGATRHNLQWNRLRWAVLEDLVQQQGVDPKLIDGGPEFNGWYATAPQGPFSAKEKSWWFVAEDQYVLSFSRLIDCTYQSKAYPVASWWPGYDTLFVHQRPTIVKRDTIYWNAEAGEESEGSESYRFSPGQQLSDEQAHSLPHAFLLTPKHPYAGKIRLLGVRPCEAITITAWRWGNDRSAGIVAAAPGTDTYHTFQNIFTEARQADGWHRLRHEIRLPADYAFEELDIYLWNPVQDTVWMDDIRVIWRRENRERR